MEPKEQVQRLFREDKLSDFDFSQAPKLVTAGLASATASLDTDPATAQQWSKVQDGFLERVANWESPREKIEHVRNKYAAFFEEQGGLGGCVLDIGGGWGLYREWWEPGESDLFIVHDPGVDRFLKGAHPAHHEHYQRAFSLPMTFVEGFGETLCYKDGTFDTCLIASTLDHCADPPRVLAETCRCLKPGGRIILLLGCRSAGARVMNVLGRVFRHLRNPRKLVTRSYARLTAPPQHMHHFDVGGVTVMLRESGFSNVRRRHVMDDIHGFEAIKADA